MDKQAKAQLICAMLRSDPLVKSETVRIETWEDGLQVEFYTKHDCEEDADAGPLYETEKKIESLGGCRVHMNDCEGCYGEGVVWFD